MIGAAVVVGLVASLLVPLPKRTKPAPASAAPGLAATFLVRASEGDSQAAHGLLVPDWADPWAEQAIGELTSHISGQRPKLLHGNTEGQTIAGLALNFVGGIEGGLPHDLRVVPFRVGGVEADVMVVPSGGHWRVWGFGYGALSWTPKGRSTS